MEAFIIVIAWHIGACVFGAAGIIYSWNHILLPLTGVSSIEVSQAFALAVVIRVLTRI